MTPPRRRTPARTHDLFTQRPVSGSIWTALAWCAGPLIVAYALAIATYRRKIVQG